MRNWACKNCSKKKQVSHLSLVCVRRYTTASTTCTHRDNPSLQLVTIVLHLRDAESVILVSKSEPLSSEGSAEVARRMNRIVESGGYAGSLSSL